MERYNAYHMSVIHLVRHGQASFGSHDYDRLSPRGIEQVRHLRAHWNTLDELPNTIYSGPLRRQRETAELLAQSTDTPIIENTSFKEFDAGRVLTAHAIASGLNPQDPQSAYSLEYHQGHLDGAMGANANADPVTAIESTAKVQLQRFQRALEAATLAWTRGELEGDFESWSEFHRRVTGGLDDVFNRVGRGQQVVICTSAGVIGTALGHVMGLSHEATIRLSWVLLNASVSSLLFDGRRCSVWQFNALPHLQQPQTRALQTRI